MVICEAEPCGFLCLFDDAALRYCFENCWGGIRNVLKMNEQQMKNHVKMGPKSYFLGDLFGDGYWDSFFTDLGMDLGSIFDDCLRKI